MAEIGEIDLALATLRLISEAEYERRESEGAVTTAKDTILDRKSSIESRIITLANMRKQTGVHSLRGLPRDYYGEDNVSKQQRRDDVGKKLAEIVPIAPRGRLVALIQQAIKWQSHTAQLPMIDAGEDNIDNDAMHVDEVHKKKKTRKRKYHIDIVLGEIPLASSLHATLADGAVSAGVSRALDTIADKIPSKERGKIKFGKTSSPECAIFLPDGEGFVTGSSDGFIEGESGDKCIAVIDLCCWGWRIISMHRSHKLSYHRSNAFTSIQCGTRRDGGS